MDVMDVYFSVGIAQKLSLSLEHHRLLTSFDSSTVGGFFRIESFVCSTGVHIRKDVLR